MASGKTGKAEHTLANHLVTAEELAAVSNFIRQFKLKYSRKKSCIIKKK